MHLAARFTSASVLRVIVESGSCIDACDDLHQTPLHYAAQHNNVDVVKTLIDLGANVKAVDKNGKTPLHFAAEKNDVDLVKMLINSGADVTAVDKNGSTPLHVAAKWNSADVVKMLIGRGANVKAVDNEHRLLATGQEEVVSRRRQELPSQQKPASPSFLSRIMGQAPETRPPSPLLSHTCEYKKNNSSDNIVSVLLLYSLFS